MSRDDYLDSKKILQDNYFFVGIIMAAMSQANAPNIAKLKREWPDIYKELRLRNDTLDGVLPGEE